MVTFPLEKPRIITTLSVRRTDVDPDQAKNKKDGRGVLQSHPRQVFAIDELNCFAAGFTRSDSDNIVERRDKNLAITDLARVGSP